MSALTREQIECFRESAKEFAWDVVSIEGHGDNCEIMEKAEAGVAIDSLCDMAEASLDAVEEPHRERTYKGMPRHEDSCTVHSPTLRPCSCGLETKLRDIIVQLRADLKLGMEFGQWKDQGEDGSLHSRASSSSDQDAQLGSREHPAFSREILHDTDRFADGQDVNTDRLRMETASLDAGKDQGESAVTEEDRIAGHHAYPGNDDPSPTRQAGQEHRHYEGQNECTICDAKGFYDPNSVATGPDVGGEVEEKKVLIIDGTFTGRASARMLMEYERAITGPIAQHAEHYHPDKYARRASEKAAYAAVPVAGSAREELSDALDVAECCVHDQIHDPNERAFIQDGLKKVRALLSRERQTEGPACKAVRCVDSDGPSKYRWCPPCEKLLEDNDACASPTPPNPERNG